MRRTTEGLVCKTNGIIQHYVSQRFYGPPDIMAARRVTMTLLSGHDIGQPAKWLRGLASTYIIGRISDVVRRGSFHARQLVRLLHGPHS